MKIQAKGQASGLSDDSIKLDFPVMMKDKSALKGRRFTADEISKIFSVSAFQLDGGRSRRFLVN
ncbi:hypothetical protein Q1B87_000741 [Salmonella enterica]|nr:hypothetical protein [Salmonella enterica]